MTIILLNKINLSETLQYKNARKTAKTSVEKDFYKLLNNSNFGNDCRNNIGNCKLELIYDRLEELKYIKNFSNFDHEISNFFHQNDIRMILEFNDSQSSAIKLIAVNNETNIKCTTRFMSGKLLMLAKLSLKSFIYSLVELLYFSDENPIVQSIYNKYNIEK